MAGHQNNLSSAGTHSEKLNSLQWDRRRFKRRRGESGLNRELRPSLRRRCRILLIDDETLILRSLSRLLSARHDVVTAASGSLGLQLLQQDSHFDAIFCDLMMPVMDGAAVFEQIEKQHPQLVDRVIFCSGGAFSHRTRALLERNCRPLIQKPLTRERFELALANLPPPLMAPESQYLAG